MNKTEWTKKEPPKTVARISKSEKLLKSIESETIDDKTLRKMRTELFAHLEKCAATVDNYYGYGCGAPIKAAIESRPDIFDPADINACLNKQNYEFMHNLRAKAELAKEVKISAQLASLILNQTDGLKKEAEDPSDKGPVTFNLNTINVGEQIDLPL